MEIDKAIKGCDDQRLKTKYNNAIYVIKRTLSLYSIEEVSFSFNGGKDSTVLLHLLRAGYLLHMGDESYSNGVVTGHEFLCPIRTIYFESSSAFTEINSFTYELATTYGLQMDIIRSDFKLGLEGLLKSKPIRAIFLGVRIGDPTAAGQEQFSPSSPGWPPFMRVNPILDWSYRDVWAFLLTCNVQYCSLYDQGYTSIGSIYDTVPNSLLCDENSSSLEEKFRPAYMLSDGRLERAGRRKIFSSSVSQPSLVENGIKNVDFYRANTLTAAIIAVGDEVLYGVTEDHLGNLLCRKLHSIGWAVTRVAVIQNDVDSVADEVEQQKSKNDMVFIYGGLGPLDSDVTSSGVAKAFGVRLAPDEEFEEYLRHFIGKHCTGDRNEMAQLPEGITQLLHHEQLPVPLLQCHNVIVFTATNVCELDKEWRCLIEMTASTPLLRLKEPFVSRSFSTDLSDVETAQSISKLRHDYPDISIGCYRKTRTGPLIIWLQGKEEDRIESASAALSNKFQVHAFSERV